MKKPLITTPPKINPIKKGTEFIIITSAYSDKVYFRVEALVDIESGHFDKMELDFKTFNDDINKGSYAHLDYDYIVPYLYLKGFISEPKWLPELFFGYDINVIASDWEIPTYYKTTFEANLEELKQLGF